MASAADRAGVLDDHGECHAVAEITNLLRLHLEVGVGADPVLVETAYRHITLKDAHPHRRGVPHGLGSLETHHHVVIAALRGRQRATHALHQVGGRGLLSMKEGWFVNWVFGGHQGPFVRRGVGAELISLSRPRWDDQVRWELAPAAHLRQGPSCGQRSRGACRSEGLVAGEHVPDVLCELACDVHARDLSAALGSQGLGGALVALAVDR